MGQVSLPARPLPLHCRDTREGGSRAITVRSVTPCWPPSQDPSCVCLQIVGAIEDFDEAIGLMGHDTTAKVFFERARAMLALQERNLVRAHPYSARAFSPGSFVFPLVLTWSPLRVCQLERVLRDAAIASSMDPHNKDYHHIAGLANEMKGEPELAIQCYEVGGYDHCTCRQWPSAQGVDSTLCA